MLSTHRGVLASLLVLTLGGCSSERAGAPTHGADAPSGASSAPAAAAQPTPKEAVAAAALVIDVRTKEEFDGGHLDRAENIPVDEIESQVDAIAARVGGDRSKPIAVYCASGGRAGRAKATLEKAGFQHVTNAGGYRDLKD